MSKHILIICAFVLSTLGCAQKTTNLPENTSPDFSKKTKILNAQGSVVETRFNPPAGYLRKPLDTTSFEYYLRTFPLKPDGSMVYYFDGTAKDLLDVHAAVLDIDVGNEDLQQCADAVIRLRAEYLYKQKKYSQIHFNLTNGFRADYSKWAEGYRIRVNENMTSWYKATNENFLYPIFKAYLITVFRYAGTRSLAQELAAINYEELKIGDVFIKGGSPGHTVIVMDVAENSNNKKVYLLAQSYMPAQDIHVLANYDNEEISPWYEVDDSEIIRTPQWTFGRGSLKRFKEE